MYNQDILINIIKKAQGEYSLNEFARISNIDSAYLSRILNKKRTNPPSPKILEKLANASHGIVTYEKLMVICGYSEETIEEKVNTIYKNMKEFHKYINNGKSNDENFYEITTFIEDFQVYISILTKNLSFPTIIPITLNNIFSKDYIFEDYKYVAGFLMIYDSFIQHLEKESYITIQKPINIDYFDIESIYDNVHNFEEMELFSYSCKYITINNYKNINLLIEYIKKFSSRLNIAYLSDYDNNDLTELFKKKASKTTNEEIVSDSSSIISNKFDTEGLDDNDIEEINKFIDFLKAKKNNK